MYPHTRPYSVEYIRVSNIHELCVRQYGNPNGVPILLVHGGPGSYSIDCDAEMFDPRHYRIILSDQRGCGKSKPLGELRENTTWDLIEDLEVIRKHIQVESWIIFGGSWGSSLGLLYAQEYSDRVKCIVLNCIFAGREKEIEFLYQGGSSFFFPEYWNDYENFIPAEERHGIISAYYKRLTSGNENVRKVASKLWNRWEYVVSAGLTLNPDKVKRKVFDDPLSCACARIEAHYFVNKCFLEDGVLLRKERIDKVRHIPAYIFQNRFDAVCPPTTAYELHQVWPEAEFLLISEAGHSSTGNKMETLLVELMDQLRAIS